MVPKVVHSSAKTGGKDDWRTPKELFEKLDKEFSFDIDAAADSENHLCNWWIGTGSPFAEDALAVEWRAAQFRPEIKQMEEEGHKVGPPGVFLNPPYSQIAAFVRKARAEADAGNALVVLLVPSRTDTQWWHDCIWDQMTNAPYIRTEVRFIRGRLKFSESEQSAPFPSAIVVFHPSVPWDYEAWKAEFDAAIDTRDEAEARRLMLELDERTKDDPNGPPPPFDQE